MRTCAPATARCAENAKTLSGEIFAEDLGRAIKPLGIIATKISLQGSLHTRVIKDLQNGRLFQGKQTDMKQPRLFETIVKKIATRPRVLITMQIFVASKANMGRTTTVQRADEGDHELMSASRKLIETLRALGRLIEEEADRNPAFAEKLEAITAGLPLRSAAQLSMAGILSRGPRSITAHPSCSNTS